jgi:demethylmenaquinone methyltransferase/2-methoxy-6-polyprenyl-1,4-benzoquinol methylase
MKEKPKELVDHFDQLADEGYFVGFEPAERFKAESLLARMRICPGWRILEPGCGMGRFSRLLAEAVGSDGYVLAVDYSPRMIELARARSHSERIEFRCADISCLEILPDRFDAIVCFNVFPHIAEEGVVARMAEMLAPGGFLYIAHSASREIINDIHANASCHLLHGHLLPSDDELMRFLETAGLRVTEMESGEVFFCSAVLL